MPNQFEWVMTVDGTHCRIKEPRNTPDKAFYSHKYHKPGVAYEIALDLSSSRIVHVNGPFKAGKNDLSIFQEPGGLKSKLQSGQKVIADNGYVGDDSVSAPNKLDSEHVKKFKQHARARQEDCNERLKEFNVLDQVFRHCKLPLEKHKILFEAVCVIVQYTLENGRPLHEIG